MRIAFVGHLPPEQDKTVGHYMAGGFERAGNEVIYIPPVRASRIYSYFLRLKKKVIRNVFGKEYLPGRDKRLVRSLSKGLEKALGIEKFDLIFSVGTVRIAFVQAKLPIFFWSDATFNSMVDYYPEFSNLWPASILDGIAVDRSAIQRSEMAFYTSEWAANSVINNFNALPAKLKVIPCPANLDNVWPGEDVYNAISKRANNHITLFFWGRDWDRKGGPKALETARLLNEAGIPTSLMIGGCYPKEPMPEFVQIIGYIDKSNQATMIHFYELVASAHFLILPTLADATPHAVGEANAFGVPCLASDVGGMSSLIRNTINGKLFHRDASAFEYSSYIQEICSNSIKYTEMANNSYKEYLDRLNWEVVIKNIDTAMKDALMKIRKSKI